MINKRLKLFMHIAFWAYMFLSPMQFMRGTGLPMTQYWMNCMGQLLMMVMFYTNYLWLTPRYFVEGKHRYFLMFNTVLVLCFVVFLHYWSDFTHLIFQRSALIVRQPDAIDEIFYYIRDFVNMVIFATAGASVALASRWFWADDARKLAETARVKAETAQVKAELSNLRSQINPHFLLNTLNNIYALTAFDQQRAQDAVMQLSKMLRHMLYDNQQDSVKLSEEVTFLENYVNLMKIRLPQTVDGLPTPTRVWPPCCSSRWSRMPSNTASAPRSHASSTSTWSSQTMAISLSPLRILTIRRRRTTAVVMA